MKRAPCWELDSLKPTSSRKGGGPFVAVLASAAVLTSCDKPIAQTPIKPVSTVSTVKMDSEINQALSRPAVEEEVPAEVLAIREKYPHKNAAELLQVPEIREKLEAMAQDMATNPQFQKSVDSSVNIAASLIGLEGSSDSLKLNMDLAVYSDARTNRMLSAILAGKPKPWVDFVIGEVGEAVPDLSYGGLQKSNNGVSLEPLSPNQER